MAKDQEQTSQTEERGYWQIVQRQFSKNRPAVWSLRVLYVIIAIGLFADFLANDKPLYCQYEGTTYFPVFKDYGASLGLTEWPEKLAVADWKQLDLENAIWPPVPYSQSEIDLNNSQYVSPFADQDVESMRWHHWLGTDQIGRDILSGMIHGTRIAMLVGIVSMSIASFLGILLGALAGYFGDNHLRMSRIRLILNLIFLVIAYFYVFYIDQYTYSDALSESLLQFIGLFIWGIIKFVGIMLIPNLLAIPLKKIAFLQKQVTIPMDIIISRLIEIVVSIPVLLLILSIIAIAKPSIMLVMVIIGLTSWTAIARFIRGELLKVRSLEYVEAAQALGYSEFRILLRHAIPNSLTPVLIAIAFGVASAILIESLLSFLGIGVQADVITWGKLLQLARDEHNAWWLAIFPGFAIFLTVTIFNLLGEGLSDALDPKQKQ